MRVGVRACRESAYAYPHPHFMDRIFISSLGHFGGIERVLSKTNDMTINGKYATYSV